MKSIYIFHWNKPGTGEYYVRAEASYFAAGEERVFVNIYDQDTSMEVVWDDVRQRIKAEIAKIETVEPLMARAN